MSVIPQTIDPGWRILKGFKDRHFTDFDSAKEQCGGSIFTDHPPKLCSNSFILRVHGNHVHTSTYRCTAHALAFKNAHTVIVATMTANSRMIHIYNYHNIEQPMFSINLHGIVTHISQIKQGHFAIYFDGNITDGNNELRFVGFKPEHNKMLTEYYHQHNPVCIKDSVTKI